MSAVRKAETFPVEVLPLGMIIKDEDIQSRSKINLDWIQNLFNGLQRGDVFPPVTTFYDNEFYWLADGFHRHAAMVRDMRDDANIREETRAVSPGTIRAEVRPGTKRDAIIFSAGANQRGTLPKTNDDNRRAVMMLLGDKEWFRVGNEAIASHVGVTRAVVQKWRELYCQERGLQIPDRLLSPSGNLYARKDVSNQNQVRPKMANGVVRGHYAIVSGVGRVELSRDEAKAKHQLESIVAETPPVEQKPLHSDLDSTEAANEARRMGDSSPGNGWRRLLWRMADLLEQRGGD